ncbi:MAG TPA: DNA-binding transcriptional regulator [Hyphomicrobiaceae bacterium]|jgi:putative transcriptional regulator|nr:DNA-binding transcriptional regulator [Hyphomicrobiaceae bacterium]
MAKRAYRSDALRAAHVTVEGLHKIGLVDKATMRRFDASCLTTVENLGPKDIAAIREEAGVSQGVFARYLNVPSSLVSQWERGERRPTGAAVKLLSLVKRKGLEAIA